MSREDHPDLLTWLLAEGEPLPGGGFGVRGDATTVNGEYIGYVWRDAQHPSGYRTLLILDDPHISGAGP